MRASLGFGCYRVTDSNPLHEAAMRHAIESGVAVIDTSSNYGDGASERLIGRVLTSMPDADVTLITKMGYAQGTIYEMTQVQEQTKNPYPDIVDVGEGIRHCIHPEFLEDVIHLSFDRLARQYVDVLLLHNPEYYLQIAHQQGIEVEDARNEFYRRIERAFEWMEGAKARGLIGTYGISSNTFGHGVDAPDFVSLERCLQCAMNVGGDGHSFTHVQMPLNLVEHHVVTTNNQHGDDGAEVERSTLDVAQQHGLHVLINRPLNALVGHDLIRLATHEVPIHPVAADAVEARIHELEVLEHEVQQIVTAGLQDEAGNVVERDAAIVNESYKIAAALCQSWNKFEGLVHWRDVRRSYLDPRLNIVHQYNSRTGEPAQAQLYADRVMQVLQDVETLYASEENLSLEELREAMADELGLPMDTPLQHIALHAVRCTAGVNTVLVGMRTPSYVDDAIISSTLPETTYHRSTWNRVAAHLARLSA